MTAYSYAQLEGLWVDQGGSKALAPVMAAIALAESGGNPDARNPSGATGLWQILGAVYPRDAQALTDPQVNAREAVAKYKTQGLSAWATYTSGAYKRYLRGGVPPGAEPGSPGAPGLLSGLAGLSQVTGFFTSAGQVVDWLVQPSHWVRIICGALGIGAVGGGIWLMSHAGGSVS
jgi:hypothetical protein